MALTLRSSTPFLNTKETKTLKTLDEFTGTLCFSQTKPTTTKTLRLRTKNSIQQDHAHAHAREKIISPFDGIYCVQKEKFHALSSSHQAHDEESKVPVYVMLPLDTVTIGGHVNKPKAMNASLMALKSAGVEGVMVDVWWGLVEKDGPMKYNWDGYVELVNMVQRNGLKLQAVMSFHQCGGNVGDSCSIPLPPWVLEEISRNPDIVYTDRSGRRNPEYISLGCDSVPVLRGRTPIQVYSDYMRSFQQKFKNYLGSVIVEIQVGMGPCGELRYPSYPESNGTWRFPGIGEFQCYDKYMKAHTYTQTHTYKTLTLQKLFTHTKTQHPKMGSSSSKTLSFRIMLTSLIVLSTATLLNLFIPSILAFAVNDIPVFYSIILSWLRPPYLYVIINTIIITIAATSRFHHSNHKVQAQALDPLPPVIVYEAVNTVPEMLPVVYELDDEPVVVVDDKEVVVVNEAEDKYEVARSTWQSPVEKKVQTEYVFPVREKPLASSRFAGQRKLTGKFHPEGVRSLRVSKPKKHETLESTWKTITDGRHIPLNRHLKKSDTFENHNQNEPKLDDNAIKKLETFNDCTDRVLASRKLRKEGSPSQDELNKRVEAFIKKFNDEMRLQRQESLQRYMDMMNRSAE